MKKMNSKSYYDVLAICPYCKGKGTIKRRIHQPKFSVEEVKTMKTRHENGESLRTIGKDYGLLAGSVRFAINKYGLVS